MNYTQIRSFNAVTKHRSFTKAAKILSVSQSAISEQVKSVESRFKIKLFIRNGSGILLTDYGKKLYDITKDIDDIHEQALNLLKSSNRLTSGTLNIGTVAPIHLMPILSKFSKKFPKINCNIVFGNSVQIKEKLLRKEIDIGILADINDQSQLYSKPLVRDKLLLFASIKNTISKTKSISFKDIVNETFIVREKGSQTRALVERELLHLGIKKKLYTIGSREGIFEAVKNNMGVGFVYSTEKINLPKVNFVKLTNTNFYATEYVCCLTKRYDFNAIKAFFDIVPSFKDLSKS
ncbi:transcriptional regulator, LysR family [Candidatus Pelagibacter sp. IMCC9063]|jgi:DNA-binding transcriptional LysR family regulator|uniref:LysR family transcriptional regulator n=1 Tax=Pelagibacter sp. (strain IMCC9063) TaxID=1002672 RepID=UPI00020465B5|nr:LysR family transcriptional regulator [Candidatus Pelagibacter sp. IMCC9063]AEA80655.1 transcriptional regulator, LysR family [Candidatus Pelagibacter sp. IMCC9063]|tara:strand:- start:172 stop:1047 length:876 start_codon:yes stop_codon:yes gene_type:complete